MIKKITFTFLFLFIAIIAAFFTWRYVSYLNDKDTNKTFLLPRLELSDIDITSLNSEKTELTAKMLIKNQLPITFKVDSLHYSVWINTTEVAREQYKKSIQLKWCDSSSISLPITLFNHDLVSVLKANEQENIDSVEYSLRLSFYTNIIFKKQFSITIKKLLPLFHIAEIKAEHLEIDSLNFKRAAIELTVSINNKNAMSPKANNIAYELSIEGNQWIKGIIPGLTTIQAKGVTELTIPVTLSFKEVGKTLFELLKKGSNVMYKLHLAFKIESGNNMIRNSNVTLESEGSVKSLMKMAKKDNKRPINRQ